MSPDVRLRALADAGRQDPGAPTVGRVVTPPHRKSEKDAPDWYEEMYERQRKVPSSHHIRVEHSIACPKIGSVYCGVMRASDGSIEWLEDFITAWHGPRQPSYGLTETELPAFLPAPLQRLYRHAGRWPGPNPEEHLPDSPGIFQQQDVLV
ncbi:hypothetical protein ACWD43_36345, partial [Streptomyces sp. NPDC002559]